MASETGTVISFGLNDRPPMATAAFVGLQHLLAVFGGILTAPLLIALGMDLSVRDTSYLVTSALVISGFATLVQVSRIGPVGSGMLSVQGTSFSFIGPLLYAYQLQAGDHAPAEILGLIFGACAVCSVLMMVLSQFIQRLKNIITANVAGVTVLLLGMTLVWTTLKNLWFEYRGMEGQGWQVPLLAVGVFSIIIILSRRPNPWLRMSSIVLGLVAGFAAALVLGSVDFSPLAELDTVFFPEFWRYELGIDLSMIVILLPIFIISATESIGDLTATALLSGLPIGDRPFWKRVQGGVLADSINSFLAAVFCTFPNTTFSQNNGVIRVTGVCSRYVGFYVGAFLVVIGMFPIVAGLFQVLPGSVLYGATLLMFIMVGISGYLIINTNDPKRRDWLLVIASVISGLVLSAMGDRLAFLAPSVANIIQFPVSSGAFVAMILEIVIPKHDSR